MSGGTPVPRQATALDPERDAAAAAAHRTRWLACCLAAAAGLAGCAVLLGYGLRIETLITVRPGLQGMSLATAAGLVALASSILLDATGKVGPAMVAAMSAIGIGALTAAAQVVAGRDVFDLFVAEHVFGLGRESSGQTSLATALCLMALGMAGVWRDRPRGADWMGAFALLFAGVALLGYSYGVGDLYAIPAFSTMAVHTALALSALAVASLTVRPLSGWAATIASRGAGGSATRRQLAFTLFPAVAGFVLLQIMRAGHIGPAAAIALLVALTIAPLALLILRDGRVLDALDAERKATADTQASIAQMLETRLAQQAMELRREAALEQQRQAALKESQDFARLALSAVGGVGVWTFDVASDTFFCDAAVAELYGLDEQEAAAGILREGFLANVDPEDRQNLAAALSNALKRSGDAELEYRIRHPDGSTRWVLSRGNTHHDEAGNPVRRTGVGIDMTRQRLLEEQLRQSQKMEAVGQLTGGVAHDFNNLLTVIVSSVDLLKRPNLTDDRRRRYVDAIANAADRAAKLTGQLLAFARRQTLKPEVFDVVAAIRALSDMMATLTGPRIRLEMTFPDQGGFVNADRSQFDTALVNLALNARDAMNGGGTLTIAVGIADGVPPRPAHPALDGAFVTVAMTDTGAGIAAENVGHIFEPFFTTKGVGRGTGLGLSQVFGFVKQSGGEVAVDSEIAHGTSFTLYLPRAAGRERVAEHDATSHELVDGHGTCVLVVEDNADVGVFATQSLEELGYRSILAENAASALGLLDRDASQFGIVFSDVVMPGMNGIEFGQEVQRRYPEIPIVLTSGYSHVLAKHGTFGFALLRKPYSIEELSGVLAKATQQGRRSTDLPSASP